MKLDMSMYDDVAEAVPAVDSGERPWGWFQQLDIGTTHQIKRIVVKPGGRLSLQKHRHRAEHWIVVRGVATVTVGARVRVVGENGAVFIPRGAVHRLENFGETGVELIEVQYGDYFGEDDIIRLDDVYGRADAPETVQ